MIHPLQNNNIRVLFAGDPTLGSEGFQIIKKYFTQATCVIWKRGCAKQKIRELIQSRKWNVLISFYSDLIFRESELSQNDIALNIHPASPRLRGVGYDTLPLIQEHKTFGVTLHRMVAEVDAGKIIDVMENNLPNNATHTQLRQQTQQLCLHMLDQTFASICHFETASEICTFFAEKSSHTNRQWSDSYMSQPRLHKIMNKLKCDNPGHPVFQ